MSITVLRSWLASLLILLTVAFASAADPKKPPTPAPAPDLDGRIYTVVFPTEDKKPKEKITFAEGKLTIQGDHQIPYWLLQKVLATCGDNGYSSFSLAVLKQDVD